MMKLWLISQDANSGYETYDSAVVAAPDADTARLIHPGGGERWHPDRGWVYNMGHDGHGWGWTTPDRVAVRLVGEALPEIAEGVVCASFNAG
jgi:hypothetical protein